MENKKSRIEWVVPIAVAILLVILLIIAAIKDQGSILLKSEPFRISDYTAESVQDDEDKSGEIVAGIINEKEDHMEFYYSNKYNTFFINPIGSFANDLRSIELLNEEGLYLLGDSIVDIDEEVQKETGYKYDYVLLHPDDPSLVLLIVGNQKIVYVYEE